jgi:transglutaminase-like putative cysteine protease
VTYSAVDKSGNKATARRKVVVQHDKEDTKALVRDIAAGLSNDPEAIRDYVRKTIKYSSDWGGDDPVWYGFKNKKGNCYVHALCLQELLEAKGWATKLIWVTDKSHYWNLVKIGGVWKHIDATPGTRHTKYSLMNDEQRLETLSGRTWDTSKWPACE